MGSDNSITEQDLDATSRQAVQAFRSDDNDFDPDLAVDGLNDSILSRIIGLITFRRS